MPSPANFYLIPSKYALTGYLLFLLLQMLVLLHAHIFHLLLCLPLPLFCIVWRCPRNENIVWHALRASAKSDALWWCLQLSHRSDSQGIKFLPFNSGMLLLEPLAWLLYSCEIKWVNILVHSFPRSSHMQIHIRCIPPKAIQTFFELYQVRRPLIRLV